VTSTLGRELLSTQAPHAERNMSRKRDRHAAVGSYSWIRLPISSRRFTRRGRSVASARIGKGASGSGLGLRRLVMWMYVLELAVADDQKPVEALAADASDPGADLGVACAKAP
jgi:hypothetical protein